MTTLKSLFDPVSKAGGDGDVVRGIIYLGCILSLLFFGGCKKRHADVRIGYLPNVTHAQAILGLGQGTFHEYLGGRSIQIRAFHAGPAIVEALFAGELDLAYLGPAPAINAIVRSHGDFVIIAGAATGGGAIVVRDDSGINSVDDLKNERILTPQRGNTQDVTARAFFIEKGFGQDKILPISNPIQLNLFLRNEARAAWTVEPWVSRLVHKGKGRILLNEQEIWDKWTGEPYNTTLLVANKKYVDENSALVSNWLAAHVSVTQYIHAHSFEARDQCRVALEEYFGKKFPETLFAEAWNRVKFTWEPVISSLNQNIVNATKVGFLKKDNIDVEQLVDLRLLKKIVATAEPVHE